MFLIFLAKRSVIHLLLMRHAWISPPAVTLISSVSVSQPWHCLLETLLFCLLAYLSLSMHLFLPLCLPHINHVVRLSSYFFILCSFSLAFLVVSLWILLLMCLIREDAVLGNGWLKPERCRITVTAFYFIATLHIMLPVLFLLSCKIDTTTVIFTCIFY